MEKKIVYGDLMVKKCEFQDGFYLGGQLLQVNLPLWKWTVYLQSR